MNKLKFLIPLILLFSCTKTDSYVVEEIVDIKPIMHSSSEASDSLALFLKIENRELGVDISIRKYIAYSKEKNWNFGTTEFVNVLTIIDNDSDFELTNLVLLDIQTGLFIPSNNEVLLQGDFAPKINICDHPNDKLTIYQTQYELNEDSPNLIFFNTTLFSLSISNVTIENKTHRASINVIK